MDESAEEEYWYLEKLRFYVDIDVEFGRNTNLQKMTLIPDERSE